MTYNVAGKNPSEELSGLFDNFAQVHDIYVIALEELPNEVVATSVDKYMKTLDDIFGKRNFVQLMKKRMTVTGLYVYVRKNDLYQF